MEKHKSMMHNTLTIAQTDFENGLLELREYLVQEGIKDRTLEEINVILKQADEKICNLSIDTDKLFYFSELIKKRGH